MEVSSVSTEPSGHAHEIGQVVQVRRFEAATDGHPGQDEGHIRNAAPHHSLDGLQLRDAGQLEVGLDAVDRQSADVLLDPFRTGGNRHLEVGSGHLWIRQSLGVVRGTNRLAARTFGEKPYRASFAA
ncbi:hypothetical protein FHW64_003217 [Variovorax sp. Sphag1AA]|nr:hypothetical protein [Variovorax sp. Sphag1AA]